MKKIHITKAAELICRLLGSIKKLLSVILIFITVLQNICVIASADTLFCVDFDNLTDYGSYAPPDSWNVLTDGDYNKCIENKIYSLGDAWHIGQNEWTNYSVSFSARLSDKIGTNSALRFSFYTQDKDMNNCYRLIIYDDCNIVLRQVQNGENGSASIINTTISDFLSGWYDFKLEITNSTVSLYVNGILKGSGNLSGMYTKGGVAFDTYNMKAQIDNIEIKSINNVVKVESVKFDLSSIELKIGEQKKLSYKILPDNATNKDVRFITSDSNIAVITRNGVLRATDVGTTSIRVRSVDGQFESSMKVVVTAPDITDIDNSSYKNDLLVCAARGVIPYEDNMMNPDNPVTKKQAAAWLTNAGGNIVSYEEKTITVSNFVKYMANEVLKSVMGAPDLNGFWDEMDINDDILTVERAAQILRALSDRILYDDFSVNEIDGGIYKTFNRKLYNKGETVAVYIRNANENVEVYVRCKETGNSINCNSYDINNIRNYTFIPDRLGTYEITIKDKNSKESINFTIGVINKAEKIADKSLYFGVHTALSFPFTRTTGWDFNFDGMTQYETMDLTFDQLKDLGVNLVRDSSGILKTSEEAEKNSDDWDWYFMDNLFKKAYEEGMDVDIGIGNTAAKINPAYENSTAAWNIRPKTPESCEEFLKIFADRYSNYNNIICELGNEVNYSSYFAGTMDEYAQIFDISARTLKNNAPNFRISGAGLVINGNNGDDSVIYKKTGELISDGILDYYAFHNHGSMADLETGYKTVLEKAKKNNADIESRMLLNETGYETSDKILQSKTMMKKLLFAYGNGIKGTVYFQSRTFPELAMAGGMEGWSLFNVDGSVRSSAIALRNLIEKLDGKDNVEIVKNNGLYVYIFSDDKESTVAAFTDQYENDRTVYVESALCYDMYGNIMANEKQKLSEEPIFFTSERLISPDDIKITDEIYVSSEYFSISEYSEPWYYYSQQVNTKNSEEKLNRMIDSGTKTVGTFIKDGRIQNKQTYSVKVNSGTDIGIEYSPGKSAVDYGYIGNKIMCPDSDNSLDGITYQVMKAFEAPYDCDITISCSGGIIQGLCSRGDVPYGDRRVRIMKNNPSNSSENTELNKIWPADKDWQVINGNEKIYFRDIDISMKMGEQLFFIVDANTSGTKFNDDVLWDPIIEIRKKNKLFKVVDEQFCSYDEENYGFTNISAKVTDNFGFKTVEYEAGNYVFTPIYKDYSNGIYFGNENLGKYRFDFDVVKHDQGALIVGVRASEPTTRAEKFYSFILYKEGHIEVRKNSLDCINKIGDFSSGVYPNPAGNVSKVLGSSYTDTNYHVTVYARDNIIKLYINDILIASYIDNEPIETGYVGIGTYNGTEKIYIDNINLYGVREKKIYKIPQLTDSDGNIINSIEDILPGDRISINVDILNEFDYPYTYMLACGVYDENDTLLDISAEFKVNKYVAQPEKTQNLKAELDVPNGFAKIKCFLWNEHIPIDISIYE